MPTRVIDVSTSLKDETVHLVSPGRNSLQAHFIALSYCWGDIQPVKLTKATYEQFHVGLPISILPKTVQDAVQICRWFDIRYIWVDALCIMQDEEADWNREAKVMGNVYQNALLTIAAQGAKDSGEGCFSLRNPLMETPCKIVEESLFQEAVFLYPMSDTYKLRESEFKQSPLFQRVWVVQERILSPRVLFFGDGLTWECCKTTKSEFQDLSLISDEMKHILPQQPLPNGASSVYSKSDGYSWRSQDPQTLEGLSLFWGKAMTLYTSTKLTVSTDRPLAIQGILKMVEERTKLENVAGLWKPILMQELLWHVKLWSEYRGRNGFKGRNKNFPSWSWLGLDLPVEIDYTVTFEEGVEWMVDILDAEASIKPSRAGDRKMIWTGQIRLTGILHQIKSMEELIRFDSWQTLWSHIIADDASFAMRRGLFLLIIARNPFKNTMGVNRGTYHGLVIRKSGSVPNAYERLAYMEADATSWVAPSVPGSDSGRQTIVLV